MSDVEVEIARVEAEIARDRAALLDRLIRTALAELRPHPRDAVTGSSAPPEAQLPTSVHSLGPTGFSGMVMQLRDTVASGDVSRGLGDALLAFLFSRATSSERLEVRDQLLLQAANVAGGTTWAKAKRLNAELAALRKGRMPDSENPVGVLVRDAITYGPNGRYPGRRQVLRILTR
ncbi:hypothetical protein JQX13_42590 [Archangium violaceum]|uniref:hypothetical protein n=1 Tax=Archangium violaceum TaxID=83451 RepID=UPI00193C408E|nr:hypothetical protein [Archangium violaceum]QRK06698.1 hypothetical protein JQX13_42590 [Archangium violaceum]